jgi:hypothetical protein
MGRWRQPTKESRFRQPVADGSGFLLCGTGDCRLHNQSKVEHGEIGNVFWNAHWDILLVVSAVAAGT